MKKSLWWHLTETHVGMTLSSLHVSHHSDCVFFFFCGFVRGLPAGEWSPAQPVQLHLSSCLTRGPGRTVLHLLWGQGADSWRWQPGTDDSWCGTEVNIHTQEQWFYFLFINFIFRSSVSVNSGPSLDQGFWWALLIWIQGTLSLTCSLELKLASRWHIHTWQLPFLLFYSDSKRCVGFQSVLILFLVSSSCGCCSSPPSLGCCCRG